MAAVGTYALIVVGCLISVGCGSAVSEPAQSIETRPAEDSTAEDSDIWPTDFGDDVRRWTVHVVRTIDHDPNAFTQGLELIDDMIVESTGLRGESTLRIVDAATGSVLDSRPLDGEHFGEGVTIIGDDIVQLTWTSGTALRYDAATLTEIERHSYVGEGWGLCFDGDGLWMSNGSARLTRRDPITFESLSEVEVRREGSLVHDLNELECVDGHVLANVWRSDEVMVIEPTTGIVEAVIDATALAADIGPDDPTAVLNGIADLGDGTLLLGGKLWPRHYVVELVVAVDQ